MNAFKGLSLKLDIFVSKKEVYEKYKDAAENIMVHFKEYTPTSSYAVALELAKSSVAIICTLPITNLKQGFGLTALLEATALGKPVIITRNKYIPQYFEDNNVGLFINPADVEDLRKAIIEISSDSELFNQFGDNSRQFALEKCNLKLLTKELASLFENI